MTAPFVRGSDTSHAAARQIEHEVDRLEAEVYSHITHAGDVGLTDDELEQRSGLSHQTASARRRSLVLKGRVRDSGIRRQTRSGRLATAWTLGEQKDVQEGSLSKAPSRPSKDEIAQAVAEIRRLAHEEMERTEGAYAPSDAAQKLERWLVHLSKEGTRARKGGGGT